MQIHRVDKFGPYATKFVVVGDVAIQESRFAGLRWCRNTDQIVVIATCGRQYATGIRDKAEFDAFVAPPPPKPKKEKKLP